MVIVGFIVVFVSVVGGYVLHGGNVAVLIQPTEFLVIGGAALGSLIVSAGPTLMKDVMKQVAGAMKGAEPKKEDYIQVLLLIFDLTKQAKANLLSLESHVEKPNESEIFKKYPGVLKNHHAIHFICDTLKVQISSPVAPHDLDELMDADIETAHKEEAKVPATLNRVGDACPGLGIVAAVLGVIITMGKLTQGKEVIGHSVAAALVGTFLGVLLAYGFIGPLAAKIESNLESEGKVMYVVKAGLLAFAKNCSPKVCVEFARRTIPPHVRPSFEEVDSATANSKGAAAA